MAATNRFKLSATQQEELLQLLEERFKKHPHRHEGLEWEEVEKRLKAQPQKLWSLHEMERTGGEPDCVGRDEKTGDFSFSTAQPRARKDAEAFVMTRKPWRQERSLSQRTAPSNWPPKWE